MNFGASVWIKAIVGLLFVACIVVFSLATRRFATHTPEQFRPAPAELRVAVPLDFANAKGAALLLAELFQKLCGNCRVKWTERPFSAEMSPQIMLADVDAILGVDSFVVSRPDWEQWTQKLTTNQKSLDTLPAALREWAREKSAHSLLVNYDLYSWVYKGLRTPATEWLAFLEKHMGLLLVPDPMSLSEGLVWSQWLRLYQKALRDDDESIQPHWQVESSMKNLWQNLQSTTGKALAFMPVGVSLTPEWRELSAAPTGFLTKRALPFLGYSASVAKACQQCELAHQFIEFLTSYDAQTVMSMRQLRMPIDTAILDTTPMSSLLEFTAIADPEYSEVFEDPSLALLEYFNAQEEETQ